MAIVYRFQAWDIVSDEFRESKRWATIEAINRLGALAVGEGVEIDDKFLGSEIVGMTVREFDARNPPRDGFQSRIRR